MIRHNVDLTEYVRKVNYKISQLYITELISPNKLFNMGYESFVDCYPVPVNLTTRVQFIPCVMHLGDTSFKYYILNNVLGSKKHISEYCDNYFNSLLTKDYMLFMMTSSLYKERKKRKNLSR